MSLGELASLEQPPVNPALPAALPAVDPENVRDVTAYIERTFKAAYPRDKLYWLRTILRDVEAAFGGLHPAYAAIDAQYHDLKHTLQAAVCLTSLLEGRKLARVRPALDARQFEQAMAAVLLHDTGFLRLRTDAAGTSAKYTFCHVLRSCAFAASYLPSLGADAHAVETVLSAINCTGPKMEISRLWFRNHAERVVGAAVATADYLGQMAAPDYPARLKILFREFQESEAYVGMPAAERDFKTERELLAKTPVFWEKIREKLEGEYQGQYRFLARPGLEGVNPYLEAVERNIARIRAMTAG
jgi:hypothetical protein